MPGKVNRQSMQEQLKKLETKYCIDWREFLISELFDIKSSKKRFDANKVKIFENGKYRYIARGESNNGIRGYIDEDTQYLNNANTISFGQDTATMFYQDEPYFTGDKIKIFHPQNTIKLNRKTAHFFISSMKIAFSNFSWGSSSYNVAILNSTKIQLPTVNNEIAFDYIEDFIATLEAERLATLEAYLFITNLKDYTLTVDEREALARFETVKWCEFEIGELFEVRKGKRLPERVLEDTIGNIALINQSTQNNMVARYSGLQGKNEIYKGNAITFGVNTKCFGYQTNDFYTIADVLFLKSAFLNKELANFITVMISKNLPPDGWDKIFGLAQMKELKIQLPVTSDNTLDFAFMSSYISAVQKLVIKNVVDWADRRIAKTGEVVVGG